MDLSNPEAAPLLGYIGVGAMGGGMARNLLKAGYRLVGYDIRPEAVEACPGMEAAADAAEVVRRADLVMTSLVSHVYCRVAEESLLPNARDGQVFVDHSTVPAPKTRAFAAAFAEKGAVAIDAPVSGWWTGARDGMLSVFVGGDPAAVEVCGPLLEVIGNPDRIIYGGEAGRGQILKVVQQLQHRLPNAARLEAMAFGVNEGLSLEEVLRVMNVDPEGGDGYASLYRLIRDGKSAEISLLFGEWDYYLAETHEKGIDMPILEALREYCRDAPLVSQDAQGRAPPDFWSELTSSEKEQE